MHKKIRVGILFGGKSAEHEVSLQSAKNIVEALDRNIYEPVLIGVDKTGKWLLPATSHFLLNSGDPKLIMLNKESSQRVALVPQSSGRIANLDSRKDSLAVDVVFPILHGPFGEDGTVQGLLKLANIPFVGASVLGSAVGMDKDVMKRLLRDADIPIAQFVAVRKPRVPSFAKIKKVLGIPFFVKPANLGSSVGVSKVKNEKEYQKAIEKAFLYDLKVIIEEYIHGREIECSVLGNNDPLASLPGEVTAAHDFYSYEAKYLDEHGAKLEIPAKLSNFLIKKVQKLAIDAFKTLACEGMARVDFFLKRDGTVLVNEINTIPGFTSISMYPKLWEVSGITYSDLIDRLITLAFERFEAEQKLKTFY